jgi:hypothetical protein
LIARTLGTGGGADGPAHAPEIEPFTAQGGENFKAAEAGFRDPIAYDYRLTSNSPAVDRGVDPADGGTIAPTEQYVHVASKEARKPMGAIDIGAFEFTGQSAAR